MPASYGRVYLCPGCQAESIPVTEYRRQTISLHSWQATLRAREIVLTEDTEMASSNTGGLKDNPEFSQLGYLCVGLAISSIGYDNIVLSKLMTEIWEWEW